jgi:DNA topoisomerase VI subunit B
MTTITSPIGRCGRLLERTTFKTSRLLDFCSEKELVAQTGHQKADWPLVVLKELIDNALDACEEGGIAPEISVTVNSQGITVADNGPGLPKETIKNILDYTVRVSSREAYMAPDRGAQGNALKTIVAMPFVLDGDQGRVVVSAHGVDSVITFRVNCIRQETVIDVETQPSFVKTGTSVTERWPDSACSLLLDRKARFLQIAEDYTWLNPHLTLSIDWFEERYAITATNPDWSKWKPNFPTCPRWYNVETLARLISAYIAHDMDNGRERLVREFVAEFRGLSSSGKQKAVLESTGLARQPLSAFVKNGDVSNDLACSLLEAMQRESKPVKPEALGVIGREHLKACFKEAGCDPDSFQYRLVKSTEPLPEVYEFAFGYCPSREDKGRRLVAGVNWSPGILNSFRRLNGYQSLDGILSEAHCGSSEPIIVFLHVASPVVRYTDRGKSAVEVT